ncbi:MAG: pilus assembly PilX N-terminal domain-containing protein, partial [Gammaproteobacteria bacterium]
MNNRRKASISNPAKQSGAALLTAMVFIVVLTIIGVSSMQNNRMEQKMTTNQQEINHSFQYAETGLVPGIKSAELLNTADIGAPDYDTPDMYLCHA